MIRQQISPILSEFPQIATVHIDSATTEDTLPQNSLLIIPQNEY